MVGDSGEAFYEHGFSNHSGPNYDEVARSFALLKPPKDLATKYTGVYDKPISHIDIVPGVLQMLNMQPPNTFQGISPFAQDSTERPIFLMAHQFYIQRGVVLWPYKFLENRGKKKYLYELYNLETDPDEKSNILDGNVEVGKKLHSILQIWKTAQASYYDVDKNYTTYDPPKYSSVESMKNLIVK
jgi:arylsulfatase A-like enzyme